MNKEAVWAATYGAAFIRQVFDHIRLHGPPEDSTYAGFREEARFLADVSCEDLPENIPENPYSIL